MGSYLNGEYNNEPTPEEMPLRQNAPQYLQKPQSFQNTRKESENPVSPVNPVRTVIPVVSAVSVEHEEGEATTKSLRRAIFRFVRMLKRDQPDDEGDVIRSWFDRNITEHDRLSWEEFLIMVVEGKEDVKSPLGQGPLAEALSEADALPFPEFKREYVTPEMRRLIMLCFVLQSRDEEGEFFLSANAVADELGIEKSTISRWLRLLVYDKVLERVKRGHTGRASIYCWIGPTT